MKSGNYFLDIANIYSRIIKESPDNITVIDNEGKHKYFRMMTLQMLTLVLSIAMVNMPYQKIL